MAIAQITRIPASFISLYNALIILHFLLLVQLLKQNKTGAYNLINCKGYSVMGKKRSKSSKKRPAADQERKMPLEELRTEADFLKYMRLLKGFAKKYCVIIVARDTPVGPSTTREMTSALMGIGLQINLYGKYRCAYAALIDAGQIVFEELRPSIVEKKVTLGRNEIELVSIGFNAGSRRGLIRIDGKECSLNRRGLNIVVYDKATGAVLDSTNFDTFLNDSLRFFANIDARTLKKFAETHPGVSVICAQFPLFPENPVTPGERFIKKNTITMDIILRNPYHHIFTLNQYFDEAGITEVLSTPKSYLDWNGVRRFEDKRGEYVNISGGHRDTAFQPEQFQRTIFLFGGCTVFGVGVDDNRTVASYLQMQCNKNMPESGIIVQNYGQFLFGKERDSEENSKIINAFPAKSGDIVIYLLQSSFSGSVEFPCIDLSQIAQRPRDYEVFFDITHYTPEGNRLIAEKLFKGLWDLGVLRSSAESVQEQSGIVSNEYPGYDLRSTRDFAGYLKLLKKYAQRYCVLVSSWNTNSRSGFTEEICMLYREVGFQADLAENPDCPFAAAIDAGELVYEEVCEEASQYIDVTLTDEDFKFQANIVSRGHNSEQSEKSPIEINGSSYTSQQKGLHFVVYDKTERVVIDAVTFDISVDSVPCYRCKKEIQTDNPEKADAEFLKSVDRPTVDVAQKKIPFETDTYKELVEYKRVLTDWYNQTFSRTIGSIVMNCNPFTFGHRFLIEKALTQCDFLIVFVVQEDKSRFPFKDRLQLVKEGTADLKNIAVFPSGRFVLSSLTFVEYFNKSELQDRVIDTSLDVTVFAQEIAPCLRITKRFAGEEPFDAVTRQYNETMRRILPEYGIEFVEIPRKTTVGGTVISASKVRGLLEKGDFDAIRSLVPESTFQYLKGL